MVTRFQKNATVAAALLLLTALAAAVQPAAAQGAPVRTRIVGAAGEPLNPDCAPDNNYEYAAPQGEEMFLPHRGCTVQYALDGYGIPGGADVRVVRLDYRVTGHEGEICGHFGFWGRVSGSSPGACRPHDAPQVSVDVSSAPDTEDAFLVLTWKPTTLDIDNAYLAAIIVESDPVVEEAPPVSNCQGSACDRPPECTGFFCRPIEPVTICSETVQILGRPELQSCQPPCAAGDPASCQAAAPCLVGVEGDDQECRVERHPGCGDACEGCGELCQGLTSLWWTVCLAFTPAGLVGNALRTLLPRVGTKVTCETNFQDLPDIS